MTTDCFVPVATRAHETFDRPGPDMKLPEFAPVRLALEPEALAAGVFLGLGLALGLVVPTPPAGRSESMAKSTSGV